jgi:hypothetical protein
MSGTWISTRLTVVAAATCLAMGAVQGAALADSHAVLPPDRVDKIGVTAPGSTRVQLPPDRADGLGTARLPTMPTPVVMVRTVPDNRFDWMAAVSGAAVAVALVLVTGAARLVRAHRLVADKL